MFLAVLVFVAFTAFAVWVVFFDGADRLEGTLASALLIDTYAPFLRAPLLRAYVVFAWLAQLVILIFRFTGI